MDIAGLVPIRALAAIIIKSKIASIIHRHNKYMAECHHLSTLAGQRAWESTVLDAAIITAARDQIQSIGRCLCRTLIRLPNEIKC